MKFINSFIPILMGYLVLIGCEKKEEVSPRPTTTDVIKLFEKIVINLDFLGSKVRLNPSGGSISLRESGVLNEPICLGIIRGVNPFKCAYETNDPILNLSNNILTIHATGNNNDFDKSNDYGHFVQDPSGSIQQNLKINQAYDIYSDNGLLDDNGNPIRKIIATFRTENIISEDFFVRLRSSSEYTGSTGELDFKDIINTYHVTQIEVGEKVHQLQGAISRNITRDNIKVGLIDTPIITDSDDIKAALVYSVSPDYRYNTGIIDPLETPNRTGNYYSSHGTQMVRYMLNYAPGIDIYQISSDLFSDFHGSTIFMTAKEKAMVNIDFSNGLSYAESVKLAKNLDLDIISFSGGSIVNNTTLAIISDFVEDGGIMSISIGNQNDILNTIDNRSCLHNHIFLPYGIDWTNKTGAIVTLNSVITDESLSHVESVRSQAGDAMYYTLSIIETGSGATSQAAATFSGIMALMLEANKTYRSEFTPKQLLELLFETAIDVGAVGVDKIYGYGLINIEAALSRVQNKQAPTFVLYDNLLPEKHIPDWDIDLCG